MEVFGQDLVTVAEDQCPLDAVLELPDVAGPAPLPEGFHGLLAHPWRALHLHVTAEAGQEVVDQERDVAGPVSEGRDLQGHDGEPEEEILPEPLLRHGLLKILVGGGDEPDVHGEGRGAADALEGLLLEDTKNLRLNARGQIADLVQEEGPLVRHLELARPGGGGAGVGALLVAEQLVLQEGLGDGGAVDGDEGEARSG
jgi:hypothetical protein